MDTKTKFLARAACLADVVCLVSSAGVLLWLAQGGGFYLLTIPAAICLLAIAYFEARFVMKNLDRIRRR